MFVPTSLLILINVFHSFYPNQMIHKITWLLWNWNVFSENSNLSPSSIKSNFEPVSLFCVCEWWIKTLNDIINIFSRRTLECRECWASSLINWRKANVYQTEIVIFIMSYILITRETTLEKLHFCTRSGESFWKITTVAVVQTGLICGDMSEISRILCNAKKLHFPRVFFWFLIR